MTHPLGCCAGAPDGTPYWGHAGDCPRCELQLPALDVETPSTVPLAGSPQAIEQAELLEAMAAIYPGDPDETLAREACALRGLEYVAPVVIVTYEEPDDAT